MTDRDVMPHNLCPDYFWGKHHTGIKLKIQIVWSAFAVQSSRNMQDSTEYPSIKVSLHLSFPCMCIF